MAKTSPLEAGLLESGLAGLEACRALGVRQLPELDKMTDRYYKVFLEVVVVVKRVVVSQHALVESVLVLREGRGWTRRVQWTGAKPQTLLLRVGAKPPAPQAGVSPQARTRGCSGAGTTARTGTSATTACFASCSTLWGEHAR
jgi:hypothetical protein